MPRTSLPRTLIPWGFGSLLALGHCGVLAQQEDLPCDPLAYGARGNGDFDNAQALQNAITACAQQAAGRRFVLELPAGVFLTGPIFLKSNMTLRLSRGAVLAALFNPNTYPLMPPFPSYGTCRDRAHNTSWQLAAVVNGHNVTGVILEGSGKDSPLDGLIDGRGQPWWQLYRKDELEYGRPRLVEFTYSQDLIVRNLRLQDPPQWNVHFYASENVLVEDVNITAPFHSVNTDGVDLDSVVNATVRRCDIGTGDDAVAIKSGLDQWGVDFGHPSAHIHLADLRVYSKCVSVGSEMSGGVHDVVVENVVFGDSRPENAWHGIFVKSTKDRGGLVSNVLFRNISTVVGGTPEKQTPFLTISMGYAPGEHSPYPARAPPIIQNLTFESLLVDGTQQVGLIEGLDDSLIRDVQIRGLQANHYQQGILCGNATAISISNTTVPSRGCHALREELLILT